MQHQPQQAKGVQRCPDDPHSYGLSCVQAKALKPLVDPHRRGLGLIGQDDYSIFLSTENVSTSAAKPSRARPAKNGGVSEGDAAAENDARHNPVHGKRPHTVPWGTCISFPNTGGSAVSNDTLSPNVHRLILPLGPLGRR